MTTDTDTLLQKLVSAIVADDQAAVAKTIAASPELATVSFRRGAMRQDAKQHFIAAIGRYVVAGDTALHIAAAAYRAAIAETLIRAGADVHARNRHGAMPLHAVAAGNPGGRHWDPRAQAATIRVLVEAGADPNGTDKRGVAPLHIAVRTRCAAAVRALLECGADAKRANKSRSTPMTLARLTTGRGGSGTAAAKEQQREIIELLTAR
jgi:hypothetical protein